MSTNLRIAYSATTPKLTHQFETQARLRFKILVLACFATQDECADYLGESLRTVNRWICGKTTIPAWALLKLEARATELNVVVALAPENRKAA